MRDDKKLVWFDSTICLECDGEQSEVCGACGGSGSSADGARPDDYGPWSKCTACNGSGSVDCEDCGGTGRREPTCPTCESNTARWRYDDEETKCCDACFVEDE